MVHELITRSAAPKLVSVQQTTAKSVAAPDPVLSVESKSVEAGKSVLVPIVIDNPNPGGAAGLAGANIAVRYDPKVFDVSTTDIQRGSLTASGWNLTANVDASTGQIAIVLSADAGKEIKTTSPGSLAVINFHAKASATNGDTRINLAATVELGNRQVVTALHDATGQVYILDPPPSDDDQDSVDGIVTVTSPPKPPDAPATARITGKVYLDGNRNGVKDRCEPALQNVTIQLTGTDVLGQAVSLQVLTGADGSYEFKNLRACHYSVTEIRPAGIVDGKAKTASQGAHVVSSNQITLDLTQGVTAGGNDFAEYGVHSRAISCLLSSHSRSPASINVLDLVPKPSPSQGQKQCPPSVPANFFDRAFHWAKGRRVRCR